MSVCGSHREGGMLEKDARDHRVEVQFLEAIDK